MKYYSARAEPGPWDIVIVGSGMGAQVSAALLSRCGHRVLVLEQHYVPGGFTQAFKRQGWSWDVGVHTVGEVTEHTVTGRLLADLSRGELRWASLGSPYDKFSFPDGFEIGFPDTREEFRQTLVDAFPSEQQAIDRYFVAVREAVGAMRGFYLSRAMPRWLGAVTEPIVARAARRMLSATTAQVLDKLTADNKLRAVLTAQWGYFGTPPSASPFAIHALVAKHYFYGGYYPIGGAGSIARTLLTPVVEAGGAVRVNARVDAIMVERGRAVGVRLDDGEEIRARIVISDAGALPTIDKLLPAADRPDAWAKSIRVLKPSPAHICLYLGFKGDIRQAGAGSANRWFYDTWDHEEANRRVTHGDRDFPVLYVSFPSLKDPEHDPGPDQLHTGEVVTFLPWETFAQWEGTRWMKRGADYEALKKELSEQLLAKLDRRMPKLRPMLKYTELSTPLSTQHFAASPEGAIYGLEHTPRRFQHQALRPRTPIKNLYLTGADAGTGGVMGAALGGVLAAVSIEPRRMMRQLSPLFKRRS